MIHFWNTNRVAEKLSRSELAERDVFGYFVANTVLWTIWLYYGVSVGAKGGWLLLYELLLVLLITVFGLFKCFEANGGSNGTQFVVRATCLSFPIGLKIGILSLAVNWVSFYSIYPAIVDPMSFREPARVYYLFMFLFAALWAMAFYWRLWVHLSAIKRYAPNPQLNLSRADDARAG